MSAVPGGAENILSKGVLYVMMGIVGNEERRFSMAKRDLTLNVLSLSLSYPSRARIFLSIDKKMSNR